MSDLDDDQFATNSVTLHVYDLCEILGQKDPIIDGENINGVWFTGIVLFGWEYVFSDAGVESTKPGGTSLGAPHKVEKIGRTEISYPIFLEFILTISDTKYRSGSFDLRSRNSNTFCDEVIQFVCGLRIPKYLLDLPDNLFLAPLSDNFLPRVEKFELLPVVAVLQQPNNHSRSFLNNCVEHLSQNSRNNSYSWPSVKREDSPGLIELEAEIEALRSDRQSLKDRQIKRHRKHRSKERDRKVDEEGTVEEHRKSKKRQSSKPRHERRRKHSKERTPVEQIEEPSTELNCENLTLNEKNSCDLKIYQPVSALRDPNRKTSSTKKVSFSDDPVEIHFVEDPPSTDSQDLNSTSLNGSPEREDREDLPPPLERIHRPIFLTDPSYLVDDPPDLIEESDISNNFDRIRTKKSPTPPRNPSRIEPISEAFIIMSDHENDNIPALETAEEVEVPKKSQKPKEPPVTFREFNHTEDFEDLVRTIVTMLDPEEQDRLREMEDWIIKNEGTWVLAEGFNGFLGRVLHDKTLPSDGRVAMLRLLAYGAAQDDIVLIMHMDRKDHVVMNYAQDFDRLPIKEQEALALLFANLFETNSASEWLLYISEWSSGSMDLSNIRVTTKVAVNALLGDTPTLQDYGTAIMHNLGTKEVKAVVFDDVCTELAMAILQFWQGKPKEEHVFRTMKAMNKFCTIAHREVPQLIKMIGPEPSKFAKMSERVDQLIEFINVRLATVIGF